MFFTPAIHCRGAWLHAIPSEYELALESREFPIAAYLRLGLSLFDQWETACDCEAEVDRCAYY